MSISGGMTTDQFWQPDQQTRAAIRRGDKLHREYLRRNEAEYRLAMIERLLAHQGFQEVR